LQVQIHRWTDRVSQKHDITWIVNILKRFDTDMVVRMIHTHVGSPANAYAAAAPVAHHA
jgi:hypothetical protein